ncbi:MAG: hypothetical protein JWN63_3498 [Candidatus Acidoferrum typicum]|nr:hypothetical protein [Candidatus Acidoferrum typicum]
MQRLCLDDGLSRKLFRFWEVLVAFVSVAVSSASPKLAHNGAKN